MSKRSRLSLPLRIAVVIGSLLLLLAGFAILAMFFGSRVQPTGDPLYDRYAKEVSKRISTGKYSFDNLGNMNSVVSEYAGCVPDKTLAKWEDEFGADPRYWELRFFCSEMGGNSTPLSPSAAKQGVAQPSDFLKVAIDRGIARFNTYIQHYEQELPALESRINALPYYNSVSDYSQQEREFCIKTHAEVEAEELELITATIDADPSQAWGYYWRAMYWFNLGELDSGISDLETGNAAANGDYGLPFPLDFIVNEQREGRSPGCSAVAGAVNEAAVGWRLPSFIDIKDNEKVTLLACEVGYDFSRAGNAWQGFGARMAKSGPTLLHTLVGIVMLGLPSQMLLDEHDPELTPEQKHALGQHRAARLAARDYVKDQNSILDLEQGLKRRMILNPIRGKFIAIADCWGAEPRLANALSPIVDDLLTFDYSTMELPPELAKYSLSAEQFAKDNRQEQQRQQQEAQERAWYERYQADRARAESEPE